MRHAALWSLALLSLTACGMAERDDEDHKSYDYLRFTDEQFDKAKATGLSDSRLYKMAGNAVTVNVISAIGQIIKKVNDKN